jgi:GT2 family glycosyltransferase
MTAADERNAKIVVIMLTMNQREKTVRALASFREISSPSFHLLLWDNGSQDGTLDAVSTAFPHVLVHHCWRRLRAILSWRKPRPSLDL